MQSLQGGIGVFENLNNVLRVLLHLLEELRRGESSTCRLDESSYEGEDCDTRGY